MTYTVSMFVVDTMVCTGCCATLDNIISYLFKKLTRKQSKPANVESDTFLRMLDLHPDILQQVRWWWCFTLYWFVYWSVHSVHSDVWDVPCVHTTLCTLWCLKCAVCCWYGGHYCLLTFVKLAGVWEMLASIEFILVVVSLVDMQALSWEQWLTGACFTNTWVHLCVWSVC